MKRFPSLIFDIAHEGMLSLGLEHQNAVPENHEDCDAMVPKETTTMRRLIGVCKQIQTRLEVWDVLGEFVFDHDNYDQDSYC